MNVVESEQGDWKRMLAKIPVSPVADRSGVRNRPNGYLFHGIIQPVRGGISSALLRGCATVFEDDIAESGASVLRFEVFAPSVTGAGLGRCLFKLVPDQLPSVTVAIGTLDISDGREYIEVEAKVPGDFHQVSVVVVDETGAPCPDFQLQLEVRMDNAQVEPNRTTNPQNTEMAPPLRTRTDARGVAVFADVAVVSGCIVRLRVVSGRPRVVRSDLPLDGVIVFDSGSHSKTVNLVVSDAKLRPFRFSLMFSGVSEDTAKTLRAGVYYMLIPNTVNASLGYASGFAKFGEDNSFVTDLTFEGEYTLLLFGQFGTFVKSVKYDSLLGTTCDLNITEIRKIAVRYPDLAKTRARVLPLNCAPQILWSMAMKEEAEFVARFGNNVLDERGNAQVTVNHDTPPIVDWLFYTADTGLFRCTDAIPEGTGAATFSGLAPLPSGTVSVSINGSTVKAGHRVFLCITGSFTRSGGRDLVITEFGWQQEITAELSIKLRHVPAGAYAIATVFSDVKGRAVGVDADDWYSIADVEPDREIEVKLPTKR